MIRYTDQIEGIGPDALAGFFEGWPDPPSPETHLKILAASDVVVASGTSFSGECCSVWTACT